MRRPLVIGLTGPLGSGRTTVGKWLTEQMGFHYISMSGFLNPDGSGDLALDALQNRGDQLREAHGNDILARYAYAKIDGCSPGPFVIDGIKNPDEAAYLAVQSDFYLFAVLANTETRWHRVQRKLRNDRNQFDEADRRDQKETDRWGQRLDHGQRVEDCVRLADAVVWNDEPYIAGSSSDTQRGTLQRLHDTLQDLVTTIEQPGGRPPSPNEMRMCQAHVASRRSVCPQRQVGAVITNADGRIVAEGWNQVPAQGPSCIELAAGCFRNQRKTDELSTFHEAFRCHCGGALSQELVCSECGDHLDRRLPRWHNLDYCRALHAEESAILQISRYGGVGLEGGVIYTTTYPCMLCAKKIVECGIGTVVFSEEYSVPEANDFFEGAGTAVHCFEGFTYRSFSRVFKDTGD